MSEGARKRSARERLAEERGRQAQRRQRRKRSLLITLSAAGMIAVVVVVVPLARSGDEETSGYLGALPPVTRQADGSIVMARPGVDKPALEVYEDFQCPSCKAFEQVNGATIKELAAAGKVKAVYRPFQLFQQEPLKSNSARAANAALCAPADRWIPYHDLLYAHQPDEGTVGFSTKDLISWGEQVGISDPAFARCVNGNEKAAQLAQMTRYAVQVAKVRSTPTAKLNGTPLSNDQLFTVDGLRKAVLAASGRPRSTKS